MKKQKDYIGDKVSTLREAKKLAKNNKLALGLINELAVRYELTPRFVYDSSEIDYMMIAFDKFSDPMLAVELEIFDAKNPEISIFRDNRLLDSVTDYKELELYL